MRRNKKKRYIADHEESWAVSYADLLMVLMSFFIVFFNIDGGSGEQASLADIIAKSFHKKEIVKKVNETDKKGAYPLKALHDKLNGLDSKVSYLKDPKLDEKTGIDSWLKKSKLSKVHIHKGLVVELPDDIYRVGKYEITNEVKKELDSILERVKDHEQKIAIVAIGHADTKTFSAEKKEKVVNSNFILASLRAAKAVEYIRAKGFDPLWVTGQAHSVKKRATRSLTLRIQER